MSTSSSFQRAHERLLARYLRRYPANPRGWFPALVCERWYRRQNCHVVRARLARPGHTGPGVVWTRAGVEGWSDLLCLLPAVGSEAESGAVMLHRAHSGEPVGEVHYLENGSRKYFVNLGAEAWQEVPDAQGVIERIRSGALR